MGQDCLSVLLYMMHSNNNNIYYILRGGDALYEYSNNIFLPVGKC